MTDDLAIPQVPEAKPDDLEDVSWALSTAEAMWARGDHSEGIKWVRRAAEAASEAENDLRALELAKAAADLAGLVTRMSQSAFGDPEGVTPGPPPVPMAARKPATASSPPHHGAPPSPPPPPPVPPVPPPSVTKVVATPARNAPVPLPSKSSPPPPLPSQSSGAPIPAKSAPRPLAANVRPQPPAAGRPPEAPRTSQAPQPPRVPEAQKSEPAKRRRKSKESFDEPRIAGMTNDTEVPPGGFVVPSDTTEIPAYSPPPSPTLAKTTEVRSIEERPRRARRSRPEPEATVVAHVSEIMGADAAATTTPDDPWSDSPTQTIGSPLGHEGESEDRATRVGTSPNLRPNPAPAPVARPMRPPAATQHDPEIVTSQAVKVVVWRDANGVHVAPAGTVVSAITVDAVLVALEPSADLTAWLSQRA